MRLHTWNISEIYFLSIHDIPYDYLFLGIVQICSHSLDIYDYCIIFLAHSASH